MLCPIMCIHDSEPKDMAHIAAHAAMGSSVTNTAVERLVLYRCWIYAMGTSASDTVDVSAAMRSSAKNAMLHNCVPGIWVNISGSVTNTRVVPETSLSDKPKEVSAGKIIKPISIATSSVLMHTVTEVRVRLVSLGKYEA